jgi:LPS-assembly lipoprotein
MQRRHLLHCGALLLNASLLSGCGFALRRPPQLAPQRILLNGFAPLSPMADELRRQLRASPGVELVDSLSRAQIVLEALIDARERRAAATTATGLVSDMTLRARLRFKVHTPGDQVLIPESELLLSRDMGYSETAALAKEQEIDQLFQAMQNDIARQVLRRLATLPAQP